MMSTPVLSRFILFPVAVGLVMVVAACGGSRTPADDAVADSTGQKASVAAGGAPVTSTATSSESSVASGAASDASTTGTGKSSATSGGTAEDTLFGTVRIVGSEPNTAVIIDSRNGVYAVDGAARRLVARAVGTEVTLRGKLSEALDPLAAPSGARIFVARDFTVRRADGRAVADGILERSGGDYSLRLASGERLAISVLPAELETHVGERIYIVGDVSRPSSWGILGRGE